MRTEILSERIPWTMLSILVTTSMNIRMEITDGGIVPTVFLYLIARSTRKSLDITTLKER